MILLEGKKVLVTRAIEQSEGLLLNLQESGAEVIHEPLIQFQFNENINNKSILTKLHDFSWVFLTSSNGVKFFFEWMKRNDLSPPSHWRWAVIGDKTRQTLREFGKHADFVPGQFEAEAMAEEYLSLYKHPGPTLFVRGNLSKDTLLKSFRAKGVLFETLTVYDTLLLKESNDILNHLNTLDALTFTSPSTIQAFIKVVENRKAEAFRIPCFCIGSTTANEACSEGFQQVYFPDRFTVEDMIQQMIDYFTKEGK
ncbi:uroporphyrinogen-III synthase [Halobacillus campisalis]|uniref:Uroporphyrinogen-III synthase n=1 Tax=Halobacillus campisalis TaxID=435909 RepID=A0ABW2K4G8_9BACI|nr:uroporphyrinogen-III synthase [Halobacillus campisalis]